MNTETPLVGKKTPEFVGISSWLNTAPLTIESLKGKIVLIDFWTYSCINCVRTLDHLKKWYQTYKDKGFIIVGIHTPEFAFERDKENVQNAIERFGIEYPVGLDNAYGTWKNYHNRYWPAHYLIDQNSIIRFIHFGEGEYEQTENMISSLLGITLLKEQEEKRKIAQETPEIYLGYKRAGNYAQSVSIEHNKPVDYTYKKPLLDDEVGLNGSWIITDECITSKDQNAMLELNFTGQHVYLVMSAQKPSLVKVFLDGQPVLPEDYTQDMNDAGTIAVKESRMYTIIDLKKPGRHTLLFHVPVDVSLYAFTFGTD
jgi:thiol-disulfide isomerase/thioredoxin